MGKSQVGIYRMAVLPLPSYPEEGEMGGESYYDAVRQTQEFQKFNSIFL